MTTWHTTAAGRECYTVTLSSHGMRIVYHALTRELADVAAQLAALPAENTMPREVLLHWHHLVTLWRDAFDPAKVRGDALRAGQE